MIKLFVDNQDISELVESITWSGDTKQVSRKVSFSVAQKATDKNIPRIRIAEGSKVLLKNIDGKDIFYGILTSLSKQSSADTISCNATDFMFYINQSQISKVFEATPEQITQQICFDLDVPFGSAAKTGIKTYVPVLQKTAYEGIMMGYTAVSRQNGQKYIPLIKDKTKVCVIEKGQFCGVLLDGDYNLTDSNYSSNIDNIVNKVVITDKAGNVIKVFQDAQSRNKYGTIQKIIKQEDGKDATAEAKAMLSALERTASVTGLSNIRAISGYSVAIREPYTGLVGRFFIESDSHTFTNGKGEMQLTLAFDNLMDERDIQKENNS